MTDTPNEETKTVKPTATDKVETKRSTTEKSLEAGQKKVSPQSMSNEETKQEKQRSKARPVEVKTPSYTDSMLFEFKKHSLPKTNTNEETKTGKADEPNQQNEKKQKPRSN